jgi:hypothetical protein
MDMRMTDYVNGYLKAENLEPNVKLEDVIVDVKTTDFDEKGEIVSKPVIALESGTQIVLNQTRLQALIRGFGPNSDNWLDQKIMISRTSTTYSGRTVPAIAIEPATAPQIAAPPPKRPKRVIESGGKPVSSIDPNDPIPFMPEWR